MGVGKAGVGEGGGGGTAWHRLNMVSKTPHLHDASYGFAFNMSAITHTYYVVQHSACKRSACTCDREAEVAL